MSAKRTLKLDSVKKNIGYDTTPLEANVKNLNTYSPTTGTREMSPFSSPMSHDAQNLKNHLSNGNRVEQDGSASRLPRRGQPQTEKDVFMELQCKVKSSLDRILKIRANLTSLQALEGSRELENVGVSASSGNLKDEVQKTQELMNQAEELQLLERDHGKHLAQRADRITPVKERMSLCPFWSCELSRNMLSELNEFTEDIDYLCVVRDLENSIKGVVQRFHKFPSYSVYTDIGCVQTTGSSVFLKSLLD